MAEVFEDSYSAEALANMENYIIGFGNLIKEGNLTIFYLNQI